MSNTNITDVLERIAQLSGTTGKVAYDSGTFADCIKNATDILGDVKEWNILQDVSGKTISIVGKNGQYVDFTGDAGLVHEFIAGNQLPTDVIYDAAAKQLTVQTGNVLDEAGRVAKKGLAIGASVGAQVVSGAVTALGGILTGVNWYENNPEFWTKVSQKLLPFAYDNPTEESWSDIFQETLFPTAVDGDGNRYIQADVIDAMRQVLLENGFYDSNIIIHGGDSGIFTQNILNRLNSMNFDTSKSYAAQKTLYGYRGATTNGFTINNRGIINPNYEEPTLEAFNYTYTDDGFFVTFHTKGLYQLYKTILDYKICIGISNKKDSVNNTKMSGFKEYLQAPPAQDPELYFYSYIGAQWSRENIEAIQQACINNNESRNFYGLYQTPLLNEIEPLASTNNYDGNIIALFLYFSNRTEGRLDNTQLIPEANYPQPDQSLRDNYPDWYDKVIQTVNPDWNPDQPESDDNKKYIDWLPLEIPDFTDNNAEQGNSVPDAKQPDAQEGKPRPDDRIDETTDKAIDDKILPDPYPGVKPEPGPGGDSGETPDPPDPEDPDEPDPDIPVISGGSANALWKIYNPTLTELRQFGSWLWSDSWVDMVKQLFANNPAEGIIGLHMIYATPITGGSANIVVGYLDSGVSSKFVSQQYVNVDCGTVNIPLLYNSALDFGYTKVYCYLPFIGIVALDSYDVVGKTVRIMYTVDVLTGTVLAQIGVSLGNYSAVLYTFNGSCSVEYPLTSGSRAQQMLSLITGAVSGGAIGGIGGAIVGAARGAAVGADVRMSGNLAGNAGAMGIRKPYIIVKRPIETPALGYNEFYGYPANATYTLGSLAGYVRVKAVHVDSIRNATNAEKNEIENLLKTGVIIQ